MRLIDGDYLYNKLVANKCPYDLVLQMVKDEPTVDVLEQIRAEIDSYCSENRDRNDGLYIAMKIIDKHIKEQTE